MKRLRLRVGMGALLCLLAMATGAAEPALPASLELHYVLRYGDLTVGRVTKTLTREADGTYLHRSRSQPEGMARWFTSVEWFEEGRFEVVQGRVRPLSFLEYRVGADKSHRHSAIFDWKTGQIRYSHGPVVPLPANTQDQDSLLYAFMLHPPVPGSDQTIHISGGKKLNRYRYAQNGGETLKTALGTLQTRIVKRQPLGKGDEEFRIWLAPDRANLAVRIETIKRGQPTTLELESVSGALPVAPAP